MTPTPTSLRLPAAGCAGIAALAFYASAHGIAGVAEHAGIEPPWGLVASIDGFLVCVVAPIVWRRAAAGEPTWPATTATAVYGLLSIAANIAYSPDGLGAHFWRAVPPITLVVALEFLLDELRKLRAPTLAKPDSTSASESQEPKPEPLHAVATEPRRDPKDSPAKSLKKQSTFTPEQRSQAVSRLRAGESPTQVARDLGCGVSTLHRWRAEMDSKTLGGAA